MCISFTHDSCLSFKSNGLKLRVRVIGVWTTLSIETGIAIIYYWFPEINKFYANIL